MAERFVSKHARDGDFYKERWLRGELEGGVRLAAGDEAIGDDGLTRFFIQCRESHLQGDVVVSETHHIQFGCYYDFGAVEAHEPKNVVAAIEICGYDVWRGGVKIWPVEESDEASSALGG